MKAVFDWLESRTGFRRITKEALYENVPGGARWRYVWGSTLTFALVVQFITGIILWAAYNPSTQTAWESVYYIQNEMWFGWLLRGIHHYMAHAMIVLLVLHLMQVVIDGAYKAPREVNFWFGLILLFLVLGLSLTGYLLPWDQKGYWATKVATSIAAVTPVIGADVQRLLVGGPDYGHHTLSRFFALHAGVIPGMVIALVAGHIYLFRRHGLTAKQPLRKPDTTFWPDQVLKDCVACLAVMAAVLFLTLYSHGAGLSAPAEPAEAFDAARPDWYFMFLFEWLKYFPASKNFLGLNYEVWGAMIIPGLVVLLVGLMPFLGRWRLGHGFNVGFLCVLIAAVGLLTWRSYRADLTNPDYRHAAEEAKQHAARILELAQAEGIPATGAITLLRNDPLTQGPKIFAQHCASCHRYDGHDGRGRVPADPQSAADLKGFASREWLAGLLDPQHVASSNYFGGTKFSNGKMVKFVQKDVADFTDEQKEMLRKGIIALSAEAQLPAQREADERDAAIIAEGRKYVANELTCTDCHQFRRPDDTATAPDLTGFGSRDWLIRFINDPTHPELYGRRNDRMPAYGKDEILDEHAIGLVSDWLRGEWIKPADAVGGR